MIAKCDCQHCGNPIEFETEQGWTSVQCPHCGEVTKLTAAPPLQPRAAKVLRRSQFIGSGCLLQGLGLILLFFFPVGTVIGLALLVAGHFVAVQYICGQCGNPVASKSVRLCPACRCPLEPDSFFS